MKLICAIVFAFGSLITAHAQEVGASRTAPDSAAKLSVSAYWRSEAASESSGSGVVVMSEEGSVMALACAEWRSAGRGRLEATMLFPGRRSDLAHSALIG